MYQCFYYQLIIRRCDGAGAPSLRQILLLLFISGSVTVLGQHGAATVRLSADLLHPSGGYITQTDHVGWTAIYIFVPAVPRIFLTTGSLHCSELNPPPAIYYTVFKQKIIQLPLASVLFCGPVSLLKLLCFQSLLLIVNSVTYAAQQYRDWYSLFTPNF